MRLLLQIAPFVLLIAGTCVCGFLFVSLKREIAVLLQRLQEQGREMENTEQRLMTEMGELRTLLREADERAGLLVPPAPPRSGFNLSTRSQALRMSRMGAKSAEIACTLGLPRREVDLLMKVQKIVISSAAATS